MTKSQILAFLKRPVPYTKETMAAWKKDARALGPQAPAIFIETLKTGTSIEQYPALLALREFGYEAWAHGYWEKITYSVAKPGQPTLQIKPAHTGYEEPAEKTAPAKRNSHKTSPKPNLAPKLPRRTRSPHRV